jgi:MFS family permease
VRKARSQLAEAAAAFRAVFENSSLRAIELAWAGAIVGQGASGTAIAVYAYQAGGASAVGLVFLIRMVPAALASPFAATLGDRYRRESVMIGADLSRAGLIIGAAVAILVHAPLVLFYVLISAVSLAGTPFRPAQAALLPSLAQTPTELTAANVVSSTIESVGFFLGPALAGILLTVTSPGAVLFATAGGWLWSALLVLRIRSAGAPRPERQREPATIVAETIAGARAAFRDSRLRVLLTLLTAQTLVSGGLQVLVVVTAIDLLGLGRSGVGFLNSAFGVGALVGAFASFALIGLRRLAPPFILGVLLWGVPLILIGAWPNTASALVLLGLIGVGNTLVDVAGFTLVQRAVPDEVLARVFGVIQLLWLSSMGIGALVTAPIVNGLGDKQALIIVGAFLPGLVVLMGARVLAIDGATRVAQRELELLRAIPIFAPLPGAPLEHLAGRLVPLRLDPGAQVVRQGDPGDRFYIVAEGEVEVVADGKPLAMLGPGGYFGEIALLRDVPRTATVTARTPVTLYALERDEFVAAVTSHGPSATAADAVIVARLGEPLSSARA